MLRRRAACLLVLAATAACGTEVERGGGAAAAGPDVVVLGPVDGLDLPGVDLDRVQVGETAPDFTAASLAGPTWTLSGFRGAKNVILVFYRGHW